MALLFVNHHKCSGYFSSPNMIFYSMSYIDPYITNLILILSFCFKPQTFVIIPSFMQSALNVLPITDYFDDALFTCHLETTWHLSQHPPQLSPLCRLKLSHRLNTLSVIALCYRSSFPTGHEMTDQPFYHLFTVLLVNSS